MIKSDCVKESICFVQAKLQVEHYPATIHPEPEFIPCRRMDTYNENVLDLLVQTPTVVFTYWEISLHQQQAIDENKKLFLKLYRLYNVRLSKKSQLINETMVEPVGSFYFTGLEAGRSYYCELGWYDINGAFYSCLQSRTVDTPWTERELFTKKDTYQPEFDFLSISLPYSKDEITPMEIYMGIPLL